MSTYKIVRIDKKIVRKALRIKKTLTVQKFYSITHNIAFLLRSVRLSIFVFLKGKIDLG